MMRDEDWALAVGVEMRLPTVSVIFDRATPRVTIRPSEQAGSALTTR